ncbi:MAG: response regulator transcription factor [Anaerovorax sp.]
MSYTILIAEDDLDIVKLLKLYLESSGHEVIATDNGVEALELFEKNPIDLAVVDIMMPKMDGFQLIPKIRENYNIPILILSAKNQDTDKILGLNLGADDYLTKPFNPLEVVARVNANLRRFYDLNNPKEGVVTGEFLTVGELSLDTEKLQLYKNGTPIGITATEYKILVMLMKSPGKIYTKMQIYENINGAFFENDDNTMMVHVSNLRDKIEADPKNPQYIKTIRGLGYKIESN